MVVYQPPVLELPVPIEACRSINGMYSYFNQVHPFSKVSFFLGAWSTLNSDESEESLSSTDVENDPVFHSHMKPES